MALSHLGCKSSWTPEQPHLKSPIWKLVEDWPLVHEHDGLWRRWAVTQCTVWSFGVVMVPSFNDDLGFTQGIEDFAVQQFIPHSPIEAFAVPFLPEWSGFDVGSNWVCRRRVTIGAWTQLNKVSGSFTHAPLHCEWYTFGLPLRAFTGLLYAWDSPDHKGEIAPSFVTRISHQTR